MDPKDKLTTSQIEAAYEEAKKDIDLALEKGMIQTLNIDSLFKFHLNNQRAYRDATIQIESLLEQAKENVRIPLRTMTVEEEAALALAEQKKVTGRPIAYREDLDFFAGEPRMSLSERILSWMKK